MTHLESRPLSDGFVLHGRRWSGVPLESAASLLGDRAVLMTCTPESVRLWSRDAAGFVDHEGRPLDIDAVFEARGFDGEIDVRWTTTAPGRGELVAVSEEAIASVPSLGESHDISLSGLSHRITGVTYLLMGERTTSTGSWARLSGASFGSCLVPDPGGHGRISISATEYVAVDEDGNSYVAAEIMRGLTDMGGAA